MAFESIRLNGLTHDVFHASAAEFGGNQERANIVNAARMLMAERAGMDENALRTAENKTTRFNSVLKGVPYAEANKKVQSNLLMYCAKQTSKVTGEEAPADFETFRQNQRQYLGDPSFLRVLAGIVREIITPILPATISGAMDWLAETVYVPMGQTYELDVQSNDIFLFEDDSWGASRSKPSNYLYSKSITLNPTLRTAKSTIKWYQLVGNNADLGRTFNAISAGMYSKIMGLWANALVNASNNTALVPANMKFTFSNTNWVNAAKRVAMLNNTSFRNVMAFGDVMALSHVLPNNANGQNTNLDAALATMLGVDWARYGYLGDFMGVRLFPVDNVVVPGTQNTTIQEVLPNNTIWMTAAPTAAYKPVYIAFEEGTPITLTLDPSTAADQTIDIMVSFSVDVRPVLASRISVISPA